MNDVIECTSTGIPYGCLEIVLLYKAKHAQDAKNRADFDAVVPLIEPARRRWLAQALQAVHPGHVWIRELERSRR
jgi:hypothetical protein